MAFSWFNFGIRASVHFICSAPLLTFYPVLIALLLIIKLVSSLNRMGNRNAWHEDTAILPGFGQAGYGGGYPGYYPGGYGGQQPAMFAGNGQMPYVIQQAPGHSVVIQPNPGGVPSVAQVPGTVHSP